MPDVPPAAAVAEPAAAPVRRPIGRVVATERKPSTPHQFHFWTALDAPVGIGTIVVVEGTLPIDGRLPHVYGVVTEGFAWTDLESPLHDVLGHDGRPEGAMAAPTRRTEIRLYTANVLRQVPEEPLQPVPLGAVFVATDADVQTALRMDAFLRPGASTGIPIGLYRAGGTESPVYLDADFLVGPEAAHAAVTGVSGLATKTSAVEFLLASLFAHFPAAKGRIAAVCFNVKGPDLLYLDLPGELSDADRALYARLQVPPEPFANVRYLAPLNAQGTALDTLRTHDDLQHNVSALTWGLREVLQYAEVLLNRDDVDAKADALIDFIRENVVDRRFEDRLLQGPHLVRSFADLDRWFKELLRGLEAADDQTWRTHHVATIRKVRNRLTNIATRCAGLVTDDGETSDLPFDGGFEDRTVYVVDVANLEEDAQDLVFARVVSRLREQLERRALGVDHVVVFVDELNKYAPSDGPDTYVRKMLLDLAERGRYLGLVLFGAQQFRSQVHRRVVGNAGTALYGRMDADELATPGYATLAPAVRSKLATLDKGELMVRHPHFTQPVFVRFPRPAVLRGRDGAERYPRAADVTLEAAVLRRLRAMAPDTALSFVQDALALHEERAVLKALRATELARPDDPRRFFLAQLPRVVPREAAAPSVRAPLLAMPDDPYA
jgi:hypothetical protein